MSPIVGRPCALDLIVRPDEQCVALTKDYRLFQRLKGHRFSVDDMLVSDFVWQAGLEPTRALDLGCGLGSVLLMVAWCHPEATMVGVEAQPEHVALARRNVVLNACLERVEVIHGDMREDEVLHELERLGPFDLITGTPPYFDPKAATVCSDPQRAAAHFELRGGIEAYAGAAARLLSQEGLFFTCAAADPPDRAVKAMTDVGLSIVAMREVLPRPGKPPFLLLLKASRQEARELVEAPPLLLRDEKGELTEEHDAIRRRFGISIGSGSGSGKQASPA